MRKCWYCGKSVADGEQNVVMEAKDGPEFLLLHIDCAVQHSMGKKSEYRLNKEREKNVSRTTKRRS